MKQKIQQLMLALISKLPDPWIIKMAGGPIELGGRKLEPLLHLMWAEGKKAPPLESLDPVAARAASAEGFAQINGPPVAGISIKPVQIDTPAGPLEGRLYQKPSRGTAPLMIFYHQGGCVIGDLDTCEAFCSLLADRGACHVLSVNYRKAPEHKFPAAADDALASYLWAREHAAELGGDPNAMAIGGDSAGGNLVAGLAHALKRRGDAQPLLQLMIYPWVTAAEEMPSVSIYADAFPLTKSMMDYFASQYLNSDADRQDVRVSPLLEEDFSGLAPAQIYTAGFDPLVDEGAVYAEKLKEAGTPVVHRCYDHLTHSFTAMRGAVPAARQALDEIADAVGKALAS